MFFDQLWMLVSCVIITFKYSLHATLRFCRWVQAECRRLGDGDNPDINDLLKTAVRCLKERPVLFKYCAEEVLIGNHECAILLNFL